MVTPDELTWVGVAKAAIGPFIGAGLAFATNLYIQWQNRQRDNLAAGNLALLNLSSQYNQLLNYRKQLRGEIDRRRRVLGPAPLWMLAPPLTSALTVHRLDLQALSFLFSKKAGIDLYGKLVLAEEHAQTLCHLDNLMVEEVIAVQSLLAHAHPPERKMTDELANSIVPIDRRARLADLLVAAVEESEREECSVDAFDGLQSLLSSMFGRNQVPKAMAPQAGFRKLDLAPLPPGWPMKDG